MSEPIRILVVDDHPVVRDGLAAMLNTQSDFEVVGEASDGEEALQRVADRDPDVLLLDLEMPGVDGIETLQRLRQSKARARAIVFTVFDTDERIVSAMKAGAKGYLLKGAPRDDVFRAVRVVNEGGSLLEPLIASRFLDSINNPGRVDSAAKGSAETDRNGPFKQRNRRSTLHFRTHGQVPRERDPGQVRRGKSYRSSRNCDTARADINNRHSAVSTLRSAPKGLSIETAGRHVDGVISACYPRAALLRSVATKYVEMNTPARMTVKSLPP